jgi:hypothetical protein
MLLSKTFSLEKGDRGVVDEVRLSHKQILTLYIT